MSGTLLNACLVLLLVQVRVHCSYGEEWPPLEGCSAGGCSDERHTYCLIYKECQRGQCVCKPGYFERAPLMCVLGEQQHKGRCDESCEKDEDCSGALSCRCNKCGCGKDRKCVIRPKQGWNYQGIQMTAACIPLNGNWELKAGEGCSYPTVYCGASLVCHYCPNPKHNMNIRCLSLPDA